MVRAPDLVPARVAVPGDQRARQLRGRLPWGVFLGSRQIRRRLPASDSRVKSPVDGQQAIAAAALYGISLTARGPRAGRLLRLVGLAATSASRLLGGHISFRLAGGANHAEEVAHLVKPGWQHLMVAADLPEGKVVRQMLGEVPVAAVRLNGAVHMLADRCSHMSDPLSDGELADGCLTCPWHGSIFRLTDGSVAQGPATAPQPAFEVREVGGAIQVCLPDAG